MTNNDIKLIAMQQSAYDLNCEAGDFLGDKNKVVISKLHEKRRRNIFKEDLFFYLACYGNACVASVDTEVKDFAEDFARKHEGRRCLEQFRDLNEQARKYNKRLGMGEAYLPDINKIKPAEPDFDAKIYIEDEIRQFYSDDRFHNALGYGDYNDGRNDMIAVVRYSKDGRIMGMAGASNDSDTMWQVGIDVVPEFRNRGVATALVSVITREILKKNIVPFYCTGWSNIASKNVALSSGYKPAWAALSWVDIN
jgi:RimJ/RimL family protein N-acetyltransferase